MVTSWFRSLFSDLSPPGPLPSEVDRNAIRAAQRRIAEHVPVTSITRSIAFSEELGFDVLFKWDNKLRTGSFKERGALNFLLSLSDEEKARGVCAVSAGNHALALSYYAAKLGVQCEIVMPSTAPLIKVETTRKHGAHVILHGTTLTECFKRAQTLVDEKKSVFVHPYDHPHTICGQGVAGAELLDQDAAFDSVIVPIGGGGLAAGIAAVIKHERPKTFILGVTSQWAEQARIDAGGNSGSLAPSTIADGIAVKTIGGYTKPLIDRYVDQVVSVDELEIARAIMRFLESERSVVEGAGAAALAALLRGNLPSEYKRPVVFVTGSNIDSNLLSRLIEHDMAERGRLLRFHASLPDRPGMLELLSGTVARLGANILQVFHDRSYTKIPGQVDCTLLLEVRNLDHGDEVVGAVKQLGLEVERR